MFVQMYANLPMVKFTGTYVSILTYVHMYVCVMCWGYTYSTYVHTYVCVCYVLGDTRTVRTHTYVCVCYVLRDTHTVRTCSSTHLYKHCNSTFLATTKLR